MKQSYLTTLIALLVEYKKGQHETPPVIKDFFSSNQIEFKDELNFSQASIVSSMYYMNTIKSLLGLDAQNSIFQASIDYKEKTRNEREAFSFSIQKYIEYNLVSGQKSPLFIQLIVLEMLRDKHFVVRKEAVKCMMLLYNADSTELLRQELIRMTLDRSPNVKAYYVSLLGDDLLNEYDTRELLVLFSKDA